MIFFHVDRFNVNVKAINVRRRVKRDFARSCFRSRNPTPSSISADLRISDWIINYAPAPDDILWSVTLWVAVVKVRGLRGLSPLQ